jgi:hypothetical protein
MGGFDDTVKQLLLGLDVMSKDEVRGMVDKLTQRVVDLENGIGATAHFHTVAPEIDASFAHKVSVDLGPHTKPRDPPPIQVTPDKLDELVRSGTTPSPDTLGAMKEPLTAEELKALIEGHKQLGGFYDSPHKIEQILHFRNQPQSQVVKSLMLTKKLYLQRR